MKATIVFNLILFAFLSCKSQTSEYVCKPCNSSCDELTFSKKGTCPHCQMQLIKKSDIITEKELVLNQIKIQNGTGKFLIEGGTNKERTIIVHYYKPQHLTSASPVVLVIPGASRNGDDYRDAWIEKSEKYNVLVLSLEYSERHYPQFWSYNLACMITDVEVNEERTAITGFKTSKNPNKWIFNDFDRIFNVVRDELGLTTPNYDMFGHSAGGQILHRLAIFKSKNEANRILASNSGWYTIPTDVEEFPYGLEGTTISSTQVNFNTNLILFLGEKDDANETRGSLRRTLEADKQGLHRLARGTYFYNQSKKIAADLKTDFNWKLEIIPGIGHDYRAISNAAADYLYKTEE